MDAVDEGLRARKKRDMRRRIAMTAMELFADRGFEDVTVAEVARAADVSEKTVFNYFATKEDLALARFESRVDALVRAVREVPPGVSVVEPFRDMTHGLLMMVELEPVERTLALYRLIRGSKALRDRMHLVSEEEAARLTPAVATTLRAGADDVVPEVFTRALLGAHRAIFRRAATRLLDGEDRSAVARDLRVEADRVYDQLAAGLPRD